MEYDTLAWNQRVNALYKISLVHCPPRPRASPLPSGCRLFASNSTAAAESQRAIITADELIIAFGWLEGAFNKTVLFKTALSQSLGEITVLMNSQHSRQQKFFDLLSELKYRASFLFKMGVMYHGHFAFRTERDVRSLRKASVPSSGFSMLCPSVPSPGFSM